MMRAETKWFGTIEVDDSKIITFDKGIIGFEWCKKFTIIYDLDKGDDKGLVWLQSLDEPQLALPVIQPQIVKDDYNPVIDNKLFSSLGENVDNESLIVYVTVTVPPDLTKMTCNLKAPVIINADTLKGVQLIAENDDYEVKYPIYDILKEKSGKDGE